MKPAFRSTIQTKTLYSLSLYVFLITSLIVCTSSSAQIPEYLPTEGLVGWWPFNGNANDESGNGNHGIVDGSIMTNDKNNNVNHAFLFDGVDDGIVLPNNLFSNVPQSYTINFWCSLETDIHTANGYTIFDDCDSLQWLNKGRFIANSIYFEDANFHFRESNQIAQNVMETHNWVFYSCIFRADLQILSLYKNATLVSETSCSLNSYMPGNRRLQIGRCQSPISYNGINFYTSFWKGKIDDIAIYNRALTNEEITSVYTGVPDINNGSNTVPLGIPYQAVVRNTSGQVAANSQVTTKFTLHQNTTDGTVEYQETHELITNAQGLISTVIGQGSASQGTFLGINWTNTTKFLQIEVDLGNGFIDLGTQQLMSVPYAQHSKTSEVVFNTNIPVFASNTAALTGGLQVGQMYRTPSGVLMVVF